MKEYQGLLENTKGMPISLESEPFPCCYAKDIVSTTINYHLIDEMTSKYHMVLRKKTQLKWSLLILC